jgi:ribosomal protein S18 acetylase RimI-like enzyme
MVRAYRPGDREDLVALWHLGDLTRAWNDPHRDIERKLARDPDNLLVLEVDDRVVGSVMVGYEGHRGWINYLVIHPDHRGRGLGRGLVHEAERRLAALGCPKVNLQVRSSNQSAVDFYRRIGYTVDDVVSLGRRLEVDELPSTVDTEQP